MATALPGIGVSRGIGVGRSRVLHHGELEILEYALPDHLVEEEVRRFHRALAAARTQLADLQQRIPKQAPAEIAAFIDTHLLMLEDTTLSERPIELIRGHRCNAEWAVKLQRDALVRVFDAMEDPYLATRRDDVDHVIRRIQHLLLDASDHAEFSEVGEGERVLVTDDVSPGELVLLHHQGMLALVVERGGPNSHTAILARSLGIPTVMGVHGACSLLRDDEPLVVDGSHGSVIAGLDEPWLEWFRKRRNTERRRRSALRRLRDVPAVSRDGVAIALRANIDLPEDLGAMRRSGAEGVGLFRTEFMFINRREPPSEREQYHHLRGILRRLRGATLTVRTFDLGADKSGGIGFETGPNPALGLRAIRLCLKEPDLFEPQLRAILRASAHGPVRLLIPMLTDLRELHQTLDLIERLKGELRAAGIPFDERLPVGGMIEVPAAAVCAEAFACRLDFLSVGTNDLIQYTLATDRTDREVDYLYDPLHPAVLRLLRIIIDAGSNCGIPVAMCGEMAGDVRFTRLLLGLGLTDLSMPPAALPEVKAVINDSAVAPLRKQIRQILRLDDPVAVSDAVDRLNAD